MTFAIKLRKLRKEKDISQDQLGEKINIHGRQIGRYEATSILPNADTLIKIAKYFNVSVDYLLFDDITIKEKPNIQDKKLLEKFEELEKIPFNDRKTIIEVINAFLEKNKKDK
jgi:transcriptional regulator with XRE-family HTH domain